MIENLAGILLRFLSKQNFSFLCTVTLGLSENLIHPTFLSDLPLQGCGQCTLIKPGSFDTFSRNKCKLALTGHSTYIMLVLWCCDDVDMHEGLLCTNFCFKLQELVSPALLYSSSSPFAQFTCTSVEVFAYLRMFTILVCLSMHTAVDLSVL